jgi:hypothetical protein
VIALDTYERFRLIDRWVREELVPALHARELTIEGRRIPLTRIEFTLTELLLARAGAVVSRHEILPQNPCESSGLSRAQGRCRPTSALDSYFARRDVSLPDRSPGV